MTGSGPTTSATAPGGLPPDLSPAQQGVCLDLLAWGRARPEYDPRLASHLEERLAYGLHEALAGHDDQVFLSKSRLRALDCDGRWLDHRDSPFVPSTSLVRGKLVHAAIEVDTASGRRRDPHDVVDHVVEAMSRRPSAEARHLVGMDNLEVARLRAECRNRVVEWRELWPLVDGIHTRFEQSLRWSHARGRLTLQGRPDLVVTSPTPRPDVATAVVVDLKTGWRNETAERADLRLYGLLWTMKYRQPPFRWATYYLAEGRWDVEECSVELLEATVDRLVHATRAVVRLSDDPDEDELHLHPGAHCRFCGRRPNCPAVTEEAWN